MTAQLIDGTAIAQKVRDDVKEKVLEVTGDKGGGTMGA